MSGPLDRVTDPSYIAGLDAADIETIRQKRDECQEMENALSYVRRLIHGRLDIVRSEIDARKAGAEPSDLEAIVARLPDLLTAGTRSDSLPRPPQDLAPGGSAEALVDDLEARYPAASMGEIPELSLPALAELGEGLARHESEISAGRAALHEVIDQLQEEIVRRYKSGEASVDSLLS